MESNNIDIVKASALFKVNISNSFHHIWSIFQTIYLSFCVTGVKGAQERLQALKTVVEQIPVSNYETLRYLVCHMVHVTDRSKENNMSSQNLSICWWPTLLRPDIPSLEFMAAMSTLLSDIIQMVIDNYRFFFFMDREV